MQRLSIARSLHLALIGLTILLAVIAGLGLATLDHARARYENVLQRTSALADAGANLMATGIAEEEVLRDARGAGGAVLRRQAASAYSSQAAKTASLARGDPQSERLVAEQVATQALARSLAASNRVGLAVSASGPLARNPTLAMELQSRQQARQAAAHNRERADTRRAIILTVVAGLLAVAAALWLVTAIIAGIRKPLEELLQATRELALGTLDRRVKASGPRELKELGAAFNAMAVDLTNAHRRIEEERRRLAVTVESLGDGLIVTEPGSTRIATVNPRIAELVPELSVGGRADGPSSPLPALAAALSRERSVEHHGRTLAVTAAPLGSEADGVVWTLHDVSERAKLERAKSEFVATASHELRSPLTSIKGFVELLDRSPENMSSRQREFVQIILKSTERLVDLVNDLLDVARIEADFVEINRRPIDAGEAIRDVVELMAPRIAEKDQRLGVFIAPTLPLALADAGRVRQIIANLLTNAHTYTPEGGRIQIRLEPERAWIQITVEDSGVGMTAEESERVFERFFRGREHVADGQGTATPGTGLGLWIVKSLVELHHGQIDVDSQVGRGTIFRVRLPAAAPGPESSRSLEAIRGRRVLIVDDEQEVGELIAGQLAPLDVRPTIIENGQQALRLLRADHYDAVTLDILMPGMDGFEVLRQIRTDPELHRTPIVCVSVFAGSEDLAGEWVVSKPIDADELRDVLGTAVTAGRSRVLVVGREVLQPALEPSLVELGIEHQWELTGPAAARVCRERRFEVALIDVGVRNPGAVLQALDLRGRRIRRAVILFSDGHTPAPPGIGRLGMEVVPVDEAASAVAAALRAEQKI